MDKEELNKKLDRLDEIINEARDIINSLELVKRDVIAEQYNDVPIESIQLESDNITTRFINICYCGLNINTVGDLIRTSPHEITRHRGLGSTCITQIREYLKEMYGIDWV